MPYVLPAPEPQRKWYNDYGESQGLAARLLVQLLSSGVLGRGQTTPTPGNPGQLQFPSGAQTSTSPLEMAQIQQMGGIPTTQGNVLPMNASSGLTYNPPTKFGFQPSLSNQNTQADIELKKQKAEYWKTLAGMGNLPSTPGSPSPTPADSPSPLPEITSPILKQLWSKAQQGDQKSLDMVRLLAIEKNDPEAILLLQQLGEL